jgi:hypothetical protein
MVIEWSSLSNGAHYYPVRPLEKLAIGGSLTSIFPIFSVIIWWYVEAIFAVFTCSKLILLMFICSLVSNDQIELKSISLDYLEAIKIHRNLTLIFFILRKNSVVVRGSHFLQIHTVQLNPFYVLHLLVFTDAMEAKRMNEPTPSIHNMSKSQFFSY